LSEIRLSSEKRLRLFSGRGFPELSEAVASELGIPLTPTSAYDFANGEIFVRFEEPDFLAVDLILLPLFFNQLSMPVKLLFLDAVSV